MAPEQVLQHSLQRATVFLYRARKYNHVRENNGERLCPTKVVEVTNRAAEEAAVVDEGVGSPRTSLVRKPERTSMRGR